MSPTGVNHGGRQTPEASAPTPGARDTGDAGSPAESQGDLVERLRSSAVQFLADVAVPPRSLRIRAGEVAVEIEWAEGGVAPAGEGAPRPAGGAAAPPGGDPPSPTAEPSSSLRYVTAPTVGTFYLAPEPGAPPFVEEGDTVTAGQQVAIVEAMKLMLAVHADVDGRVVEVLKGNGESVEYGERLIALAAEAS